MSSPSTSVFGLDPSFQWWNLSQPPLSHSPPTITPQNLESKPSTPHQSTRSQQLKSSPSIQQPNVHSQSKVQSNIPSAKLRSRRKFQSHWAIVRLLSPQILLRRFILSLVLKIRNSKALNLYQDKISSFIIRLVKFAVFSIIPPHSLKNSEFWFQRFKLVFGSGFIVILLSYTARIIYSGFQELWHQLELSNLQLQRIKILTAYHLYQAHNSEIIKETIGLDQIDPQYMKFELYQPRSALFRISHFLSTVLSDSGITKYYKTVFNFLKNTFPNYIKTNEKQSLPNVQLQQFLSAQFSSATDTTNPPSLNNPLMTKIVLSRHDKVILAQSLKLLDHWQNFFDSAHSSPELTCLENTIVALFSSYSRSLKSLESLRQDFEAFQHFMNLQSTQNGSSNGSPTSQNDSKSPLSSLSPHDHVPYHPVSVL